MQSSRLEKEVVELVKQHCIFLSCRKILVHTTVTPGVSMTPTGRGLVIAVSGIPSLIMYLMG